MGIRRPIFLLFIIVRGLAVLRVLPALVSLPAILLLEVKLFLHGFIFLLNFKFLLDTLSAEVRLFDYGPSLWLLFSSSVGLFLVFQIEI